MKKKGLIVATIVMVLVLAVSLTTATYAWFSTTSVTTISYFDVSVTSNSDVLIGLKNTSYGFAATPDTSNFSNGAVAYASGSAGSVAGYWSDGSVGLGTKVEPTNIVWGSQSKAVALNKSGTTLNTASAQYEELGNVSSTDMGLNVAASASRLNEITAGTQASAGVLENLALAKANNGGDDGAGGFLSGDYVYYLLGAMPARDLPNNDLVVSLNWGSSTWPNLGIIAAIHVCYRTRIGGATSKWTDVDIMGNSYHQNTLKGGVTTNIVDGTNTNDPLYLTDYKASTGAADAANTYALIIPLSKTANTIDQIEMIIYLDGNDSDCIDAGTGASCRINLWFATSVKKSA